MREFSDIINTIFCKKNVVAIPPSIEPVVFQLEMSGEQMMRYTYWLHSRKHLEFLHDLKGGQLFGSLGRKLINTRVSTGFSIEYDKKLSAEEFVFFFHYLKDVFVDEMFTVTSALKKCYDQNGWYIEKEIFELKYVQSDIDFDVVLELTYRDYIPVMIKCYCVQKINAKFCDTKAGYVLEKAFGI